MAFSRGSPLTSVQPGAAPLEVGAGAAEPALPAGAAERPPADPPPAPFPALEMLALPEPPPAALPEAAPPLAGWTPDASAREATPLPPPPPDAPAPGVPPPETPPPPDEASGALAGALWVHARPFFVLTSKIITRRLPSRPFPST